MFQFGSAAKASPEFVPGNDARDWIAGGIIELAPRLGAPAREPRLLTDTADIGLGRAATPKDLDGLFDMICAVQEVVGQSDVELTLLEIDQRGGPPRLPASYQSLGDSNGKLLHTMRSADEYLLLFTPAVFKVRELLLAAIARELGRVALVEAGLGADLFHGAAAHGAAAHGEVTHEALMEWEADAELAAIMLGMGIWVANGAYVYENACCGGGCGIDLRSLRAGLSLPEACYALALDSQRKGIARRAVVKHLSPTQKTATKSCWSHLGRELPPALAAAEPTVLGQLRA